MLSKRKYNIIQPFYTTDTTLKHGPKNSTKLKKNFSHNFRQLDTTLQHFIKIAQQTQYFYNKFVYNTCQNYTKRLHNNKHNNK